MEYNWKCLKRWIKKLNASLFTAPNRLWKYLPRMQIQSDGNGQWQCSCHQKFFYRYFLWQSQVCLYVLRSVKILCYPLLYLCSYLGAYALQRVNVLCEPCNYLQIANIILMLVNKKIRNVYIHVWRRKVRKLKFYALLFPTILW